MVRLLALLLLLSGCPDGGARLAQSAPGEDVEDLDIDAQETGEAPDTAQPDLPEPECRGPSDCPAFFTCRAGECVETGCRNDSECGAGNRCIDAECHEVGAGSCETNGDCGWRWRCAQAGVCIEGQCLDDRDCDDDAWCTDALCVDRRGAVRVPTLQRIHPSAVSDHLVTITDDYDYGYSGGAALFDLDGDLDLDLFLGRQSADASPACVYRNVSTPGVVAFEPIPALCDGALGPANTAWGFDIDADGLHELFILGEGTAHLWRFPGGNAERAYAQDVMDGLPPEPDGGLCSPGAVSTADLDLDGAPDLVIGCKDHEQRQRPRQTSWPNRVLRNDGERFVTTVQHQALSTSGSTLGLGLVDLNDDGFLDVVVANDSFTTREEASGEPAGFLYWGCADAHCEPEPFGVGQAASGSFMGIGVIDVDGAGPHVYLSDLGPNRLLRFGPAAQDVAPDLGVEAIGQDTHIYSWGVVVEDFDRNGLDDIFVAQGSLATKGEAPAPHPDLLYLQTAGGVFVEHGAETPVVAVDREDSGNPDRDWASRGALRADLDGDGTLEVLILGIEGRPVFASEVPDPFAAPRCTLVPRPRLVPGFGFGFALGPEGGGLRTVDVQGQLRGAGSPFLLSAWSRGRVRFPSGYVASFDCGGGPGPVEIVEPEWISVEGTETARVMLDGAPALGVAVRFRVEGVAGEVLDGGEHVVPDGADGVMVRVGGRWVARWFLLGSGGE